MKSSDVRKIKLICVLLLLCLAAGAWLLLFDRSTARIAGQRRDKENIQHTISSVQENIKDTGNNVTQRFLETWLFAEHVYPHGHTYKDDEHTFAAYDEAIDAGAHYIDTDVVISADGTLYVSHDLSAARIAGVNRFYSSMKDSEIENLRGQSGEKILKLSEVLDKYGTSVKYLIEMKSSDDATLDAFKTEIDKRGLSDRVILQSEVPELLEKTENYYPDMQKMLIIKNSDAFNLALSEDYIDIVGARIQFMTQANCDTAHNAGKKFVGWPIDSESEIINAISIGADAYFTDDTKLALELERKYRNIQTEEKDTIFFVSDYQPEDGFDSPKQTLKALMNTVISEGKHIDAAVVCGDYTNKASLHDYQLSPEKPIAEIKGVIKSAAPELNNDSMLFVQGNHDSLTESIAESGLHEYSNYLVYVLNTENDFPWKQGKVSESYDKVKTASEEMRSCFDGLIERGETRPVFIAGHVPLHFTARTSSRHSTGDNLYSSLIFDVVNDAAESLDIIYMYGHNHSKGWDCYMGGAAVYKAIGDSMLLPVFSEGASNTDDFEERRLNFTYMNAGYGGYYINCGPEENKEDYKAADETLTCTVCEIYDDRIEIRRYDEAGEHVLGANGEGNPFKGGIDADLIDSKYYSKRTDGPAVIERKKDAGAVYESREKEAA